MISTILWDFDGVILDSMKVRDLGFYHIFKDFDLNAVEELMKFHRLNGGLSRYVKIRYFFEEILKRPVADEQVLKYANIFSEMMRKELPQEKYLIVEAIDFIKKHHAKINFHIVSGSDGNELRYLCDELGLTTYFITIEGSPTPKKQLVKTIIDDFGYKRPETVLIGDSINDFEAATQNKIGFWGYNNPELKTLGTSYIETFEKTLI